MPCALHHDCKANQRSIGIAPAGVGADSKAVDDKGVPQAADAVRLQRQAARHCFLEQLYRDILARIARSEDNSKGTLPQSLADGQVTRIDLHAAGWAKGLPSTC